MKQLGVQMRKIGIAAMFFAAVILLTAIPTQRAKADSGATIAATVVAGIVTVASLKCTDSSGLEYLCILAPFNSAFCGLFSCTRDPKTGKVAMPKQASLSLPNNFIMHTAVRTVKAVNPSIKFPKEREAKAPKKQERVLVVSQMLDEH